MISAEQLRAARGLLGWNQSRLAQASNLALSTIKRMERPRGLARGISENVMNVQRALEDAGIIFIDENGGGPGVRLRRDAEKGRGDR